MHRQVNRTAGKQAPPPRLHLLAGCRALLAPLPLRGEQIALLLGDEKLRSATAFWLSPRCGRFYHDFLLEADEDPRVAVFAQTLRENFGDRFEPLIVLPDLIGETASAVPLARSPLDVLLEIRRRQPDMGLVLHALTLPAGTDADASWVKSGELLASQTLGRLDGLRATLAAAGHDPVRIEIRTTEVSPAVPGFEHVLRNAVASQIALRLEPQLAMEGLAADIPRLETAIAQILAGWSVAGLKPARSLGTPEFEALSGRVSAALSSYAQAGADA